MFRVAAFGDDRGAMLKPPPQQCLSNCLAILLCNMGYFCILHHTLAVLLQASRGFPDHVVHDQLMIKVALWPGQPAQVTAYQSIPALVLCLQTVLCCSVAIVCLGNGASRAVKQAAFHHVSKAEAFEAHTDCQGPECKQNSGLCSTDWQR